MWFVISFLIPCFGRPLSPRLFLSIHISAATLVCHPLPRSQNPSSQILRFGYWVSISDFVFSIFGLFNKQILKNTWFTQDMQFFAILGLPGLPGLPLVTGKPGDAGYFIYMGSENP